MHSTASTSATLSKRFVSRLATMVESGLLTHEFYVPWADELILRLDVPPVWLLDLCTTRYRPRAVDVLRKEACSPPFEQLDAGEESDEFLACLILRHRRGEISWATLLDEGGRRLDAASARRDCEWLFEMLTELEHHEYSKEVEARQREAVEAELRDALERIEPVYGEFLGHFRRAVASASS